MSEIQDGSGTKRKATVDSSRRLLVRSVSEPASREALRDEKEYMLHSSVMNLTSANNSYLAYFKNLSDLDFVITYIDVSSEKSNEDTGTLNVKQTGIVRIRKNPTGPSFSNTWTTNNADFGSTAVLNADAFNGVEGSTFTDDGILAIHLLVQCGTVERMPIEEVIIRKNNSIGFGFQPPSGNTDINVHFNMIGYQRVET